MLKRISKILAFVLVLTAFVGVFAACSESDVPEGYQLVACKGDKFRLYVPTQWVPNYQNGVTGAYYSTGVNVSVSVYKADDAGELSVEEYWEKCLESFKAEMKDFAFLGDEKATLGAQRARKYIYTATKTVGDKTEKYKFMQVMARYEGEMYILLFTSPEKLYDEHVGAVVGTTDDAGIIKHFKFAAPYEGDEDKNKEYSDKVTPPEGMKLASTDKLPYRFFVPTSWKINEKTASAAAYVSDTDSSNVSVQMYMMGDDSPKTVEDYFAKCEKSYKEMFSSYALESVTDIKLDSVAGKQYIYSLTSGGESFKQLQAIVRKGEVYYTVTYTAKAELFEKHMNDVKKMLETFIIR